MTGRCNEGAFNLTQNEKINALIYEADHEEPPERLFQYTSLGVLSLILQNKTIRFNSLENLDDLEESSLQFCDDNPPVTYVSCWTSIVEESIPMWKLYTQMTDGIRIELPIGPFKDPRTQNGNCVPGSYDYRAAKWIPVLPPSRVDPELVYMAQPYSLNHPNRVIYRDDLTASEIVASKASGQNAVVTHNGAIARFKRNNWDFQQEFRYIVILQRARNNIPLKPYYDADLDDAAISNMRIVVSPMFSDSNYLLLDALLKKYDYGIKPSDSALKGKIKLK